MIPLQVHETVRAQVQQRRPCAVHQVALRASDHPQTGDKHDARPFSSSHQPTQVSTPPTPHLITTTACLHDSVYFEMVVVSCKY